MVDAFLPAVLRPSAPDATLPRHEYVTALIQLCTDRPENAEALADVMTSLEGDTPHIRQLRMLCDQRLAQTRFPEADFHRLRPLVDAVSVEDVQEIAAASMEPLPSPLPAHCNDAWSILLHLLRRNVPMHGLPPFMTFLEYLAAAAPVPDGDAIRDWNQELAQKSGRVPQLEDCRRQAGVAVGRATTEDERRLMFVLMPDGLEDDVYILVLWRTDSTGHRPALRDSGLRLCRDDIAHEVGVRLATTLSAARGRRPRLTVEFWLPMALVNEPVWDWCRAVKPTAETADDDYTVLVRSLDRLQSPEWRTSLRRHWVVTSQEAEQAAQRIVPLASDSVSTRCVVLSEPPDVLQGKRELMAALEIGIPAILWQRHDRSDAVQRWARNVAATCSLEELPGRVAEYRRKAGAQHDAQIALLWDTPDHALPDLSPLVTPDEAASS